MNVDPAILAPLSVLCSGLLGLATLLVKRHLRLIDRLETNDDTKTATMQTIAHEIAEARRERAADKAEMTELRKALEDRRLSELGTRVEELASRSATGSHVAIEEEPLATARAPLHTPGRGMVPVRPLVPSRPR